MAIYLYKKTHRKTGLNYLGKTTQDPSKYKGSGLIWIRHIKKHGNDVETTILKECSSNEEVKVWGLHYSNLWNIVESNEWANIKPEAGEGGSLKGRTLPSMQGKVRTIKAPNIHSFLVANGQKIVRHQILKGQIANLKIAFVHVLVACVAKKLWTKRILIVTTNPVKLHHTAHTTHTTHLLWCAAFFSRNLSN